MIAYGRGKEALACSCRSRDEPILPLPHEVEREQPLHLVLVKPAADTVVYLLGVGIVAEGGSLRYLQLSANSRWRSDAYCIFINCYYKV